MTVARDNPMLVNHSIIKNKYRCNNVIKEYLVKKCHLPILSYDDTYYYFARTAKLEECLKSIPFGIQLKSSWSNKVTS